MTQPFGSGCPNLPETGVGSLQDLSEQGVATAVSEVPQLSQLGVTVRFAELQGTLNNASDVTVFAPNDAAFQSLGLDRARKLVADPSQAVGVLKYHVVPKRLSPEELPGTHETLEAGKSLTVKGSGQDFTVNDAKVVCGNIQAANGTIYLIDGVLQP
ncbi:MAG: fasciclin domain-containing protein [Microlunatus sp.]|nr:fasciclin domain-containing protein [Microlunatus sp.]MDN5770891.1 fasciclin domain-containing protein [Microlunatus sp.]MDN5803822.1 fasciclin domain-containing protein [Microlunatus sp.]